MTEITLEAIQAKQAKLEAKQTQLAELIAKFTKPLPAVLLLAIAAATIELQPGEHYAGAVLNDDGTIKHHLVLMAPKPPGKLAWAAALTWAKSIGGFLPTRQEGALIFANCKAHVEASWHWLSEEYAPNVSYAWLCYLDNGNQIINGKSFEGSAVAVRRVLP